MNLRSILPYLLLFAAISGYLFFRMQTASRTPRRPMRDARRHERGRASHRLRIRGSWDELGRRDKRRREK
jgi:hypothetical protein